MRPLPTGEPWGDFAVSTARWTGALLHEVLAQARPQAAGVDVRFDGADHGAYHLRPVLAETDRSNVTFTRSLPLSHAVDPAAEILIAYEMNGEPLPADHGAPFRIVVPHWYAVASVKWLKRIDVLTEPYSGEFQTGHYIYQWADRPHEPVTLMRVRSRITDPAPGIDHRPRPIHRARQGMVGNRTGHRGGRQPHRRRRLATRPAPGTQRPVPMAGLVLRLGCKRGRTTYPTSPRNRRSRQCPTRCPTLEPARVRKQRDRGPLRRRPLKPDPQFAGYRSDAARPTRSSFLHRATG